MALPERRARIEKAGGASPAPTEVNTMSQTIPFTQAAEFLKAHDNYLILTHKRPDGDTIGCAAGLCRALRKLGKTAYVLHNEDATVLMGSYLEGLTAPDGFAPDTVVSTDVATENLLPDSAAGWKGRIDLAIDHHPSQEFFAKETCLEADKAACGEIIWRICGELGTMDGEIAVPLYVAIATDCGCFVYANTTPHTHRAAAALMEQGIDFQALNKRHFRTKSVARMKLESLIIEHMHLYHNGTVAVAPISLELIARAGATSEDTDDIAAFLGQLKGVLHTATIREHEGGECRVSVRTKADELNATRVCARLGGGGHKAASGCTIKGTVEEAERAILAAIDDQLAQPSQD